jgi:hypothetical protein
MSHIYMADILKIKVLCYVFNYANDNKVLFISVFHNSSYLLPFFTVLCF